MVSTYWLIALALLLVIEILTLGLTTIWFAGGALVAFLVSLVTDSLILQLVVFLVVSFVLLFFTRPVASRYLNSKRVKTNYESLIGQEVKVLERIDNFNNAGLVQINGLEWMARAVDEDAIIEPGERVIIREVSGVKVIVEVEK
ncbi:MAG: putative rane protein [Anaerocolumna sp.]|jgi:membrane protein implicated in regulation of membrane protease activity|nr:putative rane protein [Anaerocolumna sp.]